MGWLVFDSDMFVSIYLIAIHFRFPFLFYSTTYVGQIMAYEHNKEPDKDIATRTGEFAMLIYSIGRCVPKPLVSCKMTPISCRCRWIFTSSLGWSRSTF